MNKLDKLLTYTDSEIQNWLRKINIETEVTVLPIALMGVNKNVQECVFRNMSVHAKNFIQEQMKNYVTKSEIEKNLSILENLL